MNKILSKLVKLWKKEKEEKDNEDATIKFTLAQDITGKNMFRLYENDVCIYIAPKEGMHKYLCMNSRWKWLSHERFVFLCAGLYKSETKGEFYE